MKNILIAAAAMSIFSAPTFALDRDLGTHELNYYVYEGVNPLDEGKCKVFFSMLDENTMTNFEARGGLRVGKTVYANSQKIVDLMGGLYSKDLMGVKGNKSFFSNTRTFKLDVSETKFKIELKGDSLDHIDSVRYTEKFGFTGKSEVLKCGKLKLVKEGTDTRKFIIQGNEWDYE